MNLRRGITLLTCGLVTAAYSLTPSTPATAVYSLTPSTPATAMPGHVSAPDRVAAEAATSLGHPSQTIARRVPSPIYGVTLDCGYLPHRDGRPGLSQLCKHLPAIVASLRHLAKRPTVRVVFDANANPASYVEALRQLRPVAYVMGELLDSSHLAQFSTAQYRIRAREYFDTLGGLVDVWEIGNEVNGNWTGRPATVAADIAAAYDLAKARGLTTALTFYKQQPEPIRHEMFTWIADHLASRVSRGIDYALVSYYDNDPHLDWTPIYRRLAATFPNAKVGFGEMGGSDRHADRKWTIKRFYAKPVPGVPAFIGGYFYWYYCVDMVPYRHSGLWKILNRRIAHGPPEH